MTEDQYLIQGKNGSLRYWAKITTHDTLEYVDWMGLKDNATVLTKAEAESKISFVRAQTNLEVSIIPYK